MLRMGRDTKTLNLSSNSLSHVPLDILNFFIKGDLTAINLSNNEIPSLQELFRVSSKVEKLWLEGNPLCEELDPADYVKLITMKFPRLSELDGIRVNEHCCTIPFVRNFLATPDRRTKMLVEKFLTIYFTHYDATPRKRFEPLYSPEALLTINTAFTEHEEKEAPLYTYHSRNLMQPARRAWMLAEPERKLYRRPRAAVVVLEGLPPAQHDPASFTVDQLWHTNKSMAITVDGIFRENDVMQGRSNNQSHYRYYSFRRTFVFEIQTKKNTSMYFISNEMLSLRPASQEQIENSFKTPTRNLNEFTLINPDVEEIDAIVKAFMHITNLKRSEAEARLKLQDWDIKKAIKMFVPEFKENKVSLDKMIEEDDFSDTSSLVDDEID